MLIDDMDSTCLGHYLKNWSDHYPFSGEVKGATIPLLHEKLIVTSNYRIEELFEKEPIMIEPLLRRFKCVHLDGSDK